MLRTLLVKEKWSCGQQAFCRCSRAKYHRFVQMLNILDIWNLISCRDDQYGFLNKEDIDSLRINFGTHLLFSPMCWIVMECYFEMHCNLTLKSPTVSRKPHLISVLDARIWTWMKGLEFTVPHTGIAFSSILDEHLHSCDINDALRIGDRKASLTAVRMCAV